MTSGPGARPERVDRTAREEPAPAAGAGLDVLLTDEADALLAALADRTRRRILVRLADRPDDAGAVARDLGVSRQAVAKQLRLLEDAGVVTASTRSRRRVHEVDPARICEISDLLGVVARGWDRRLALVKNLAEGRAAATDRAVPDGGEDGPAPDTL